MFYFSVYLPDTAAVNAMSCIIATFSSLPEIQSHARPDNVYRAKQKGRVKNPPFVIFP